MIRPPPSSPLFPYTPPSRSGGGGAVGGGPRHRRRRPAAGGPARAADREPAGRLPPRQRAAATRPDRKSTRLNSSHANISYAVFCLKKKIKIQIQLTIYIIEP